MQVQCHLHSALSPIFRFLAVANAFFYPRQNAFFTHDGAFQHDKIAKSVAVMCWNNWILLCCFCELLAAKAVELPS
jgi:hypothetical protein